MVQKLSQQNRLKNSFPHTGPKVDSVTTQAFDRHQTLDTFNNIVLSTPQIHQHPGQLNITNRPSKEAGLRGMRANRKHSQPLPAGYNSFGDAHESINNEKRETLKRTHFVNVLFFHEQNNIRLWPLWGDEGLGKLSN